MKENPLKKLEAIGQSIWLDYIRRDLIISGELRHLIENDGLRGMTSNPSIFEKAIAESNLYDQNIHELALNKKNAKEIYESLTQQDVQNAADEFRAIYDQTNGEDGYVSLEVNPHLAHDTTGAIEEARRLWTTLDRPNILIKIPATDEGLPVIKQLISEGINVDATLIFGLDRYRQVIEAYIAGLEERADQKKSLNRIASVASFFLSRIDSVVDPIEEEFVASTGEQALFASNLRGQVAISSAKIAYKIYKKTFEGEPFLKLGALAQKLVWASTSPKDPDYSDIKYVEALIGSNTVNTLPLETLEAYRDHGDPSLQLEVNIENATWVMSELSEVGIDIKKISKKLENNGVKQFIDAFDKLLKTISKKASASLKE